MLAELDPSQSHEIELRVNSAQWQVRGQEEGQGREGRRRKEGRGRMRKREGVRGGRKISGREERER